MGHGSIHTVKVIGGLLPLLAVVAAVRLQAQPPQTSSCSFSLTPSGGPSVIVGPDAVKSRLHIISQPDSPIEILSADFTGTELLVSGNGYTIQQNASPMLEVRNRSTQSIKHIDMRVSVGPCRNLGRGGGPAGWDGLLSPGTTTRIQNRGTGGGSGSSSGLMLVFLWVDRVDFEDCVYRPAQIIPRSVCGTEVPQLGPFPAPGQPLPGGR
jgi:hypothetical protein